MKSRTTRYLTLLTFLFMLSAAACATLPATEIAPKPTPTPLPASPTAPAETIPPVAQLAIKALAAETGLPADSITLLTFQGVDWPDGCLGIEYKDTACTDAIVPGFQIILEADGQTYEYRSNQDGSVLLLAPEATFESKIGDLARDALARQLGIAKDTITVVRVEAVDWPDGCLGITLTEMGCITVITPGFRIVLQTGGQTFEYHSNQDGSQMLLATPVPAPGEIPALQVDIQGGIAGFCDHVNLFLSGLATYRACDALQETRYQLTAVQLQTLQTLVSEYAAFETTQSDPAVADQMIVQILFNGQGKNPPTPELYQQLQALGMEVIHIARGLSPDSNSAQYAPLTGLIYTTGNGLWQIGADGTPKQLFPTVEARLFPDGQQLLSWDGNDLFLTSLSSGEIRNLTNTPNRIEMLPPSGGFVTDKIFFTSFSDTVEGTPGFNGYLTMVNPDGSGYVVLDEENNAGLFAVSPDEHTVAYGGGATAWLYHLDSNTRETFNPATYSLPDIAFLSSPSWSPNGEMLAWIASGNFGEQEQFALAVFDLKAGIGAIFHPHQLSGLGSFPPAGVWSQNGEYVALTTFNTESGLPETWLVPVVPLFNRRPEFRVGGIHPVWSLDGRLIVVSSEDGSLLLVDTAIWETTAFAPPEKIFTLLDWR